MFGGANAEQLAVTSEPSLHAVRAAPWIPAFAGMRGGDGGA